MLEGRKSPTVPGAKILGLSPVQGRLLVPSRPMTLPTSREFSAGPRPVALETQTHAAAAASYGLYTLFFCSPSLYPIFWAHDSGFSDSVYLYAT